jgi:SAM-dependent methyltransferase
MEIAEALEAAFGRETYKCIISNPREKSSSYNKITISKLDTKYYVEKFTATQVLHETIDYIKEKAFALELLQGGYRGFNSWGEASGHEIKVSKRGKVLLTARGASGQAPRELTAHNRQKDYILKQGEDIPPLVDMGIFTKDGKVKNAMYDKYRQINRFIEIIDDEVKTLGTRPLRVLDFGCGKSYLTFVLYHYFTKIRGLDISMTGLDLKSDVIEKCRNAASRYGYDKLAFQVGDIGKYDCEGKLDIVVTLHACDTATDYALYHAIRWGAERVFSVPCCQHELNSQIDGGHFSLLTRYGIVKERFSSLLTDAVRANLLECCGYRTQMVEFVAFDHTPKNIMLRAVKRGARDTAKERSEVERVVETFGLDPTLYRLLLQSGHIALETEKPI